jgi:hypothetical protein
VEAAFGIVVEGLVAIIESMRTAVDQLEAELTREFETHPMAQTL